MPPPREPSKTRQPFPRGPALSCFLLLAALAATEAAAPGRMAADAGVAEGQLDAGTEEPSRVDTQRSPVLAGKAGPPVPATPGDWQKTARCLPDAEERIHGACYVRTAKTPPCPPSFYESQGGCFVAVTKVPRTDTSIEK